MATALTTNKVDWSVIWSQRGFRYFSVAMFVSLFGSGLNFTAVSWYILTATHSTIAVSMQVIVVTLPGLFVPFLGGVLIDRYDRRYLGIMLDIARGLAVLTIAYLAWKGHLDIWHLYVMTLITGTGSAMYWACVNALVQEVMPPNQFTGANAAVLIGVQSGMLMAGAFVGFIYDTIGIAGILAIDGATYVVSAFCLYKMRSGYVSPRPRYAPDPDQSGARSSARPTARSRQYSEATEATALALESGGNPEVAEAGLSLSVFDDLKEGFAYLKSQPKVLALGVTHATMMAGVVSANVILVALANDVLHAGARGLGYLEGGWAIGAISGGLLASQLNDKLRMSFYVGCIAVLCAGHIVVPFVAFVVGAVTIQAIFGFCRAVSGVVAQSTLMMIVPRHFMGRTQSSIAIFTTILQILMSISLGWVAQRISLFAGFSLLGLMYAGAGAFATRARALLTENS
jgi:MFS transporter, DHA3 family, macrolide efflux protein